MVRLEGSNNTFGVCSGLDFCMFQCYITWVCETRLSYGATNNALRLPVVWWKEYNHYSSWWAVASLWMSCSFCWRHYSSVTYYWYSWRPVWWVWWYDCQLRKGTMRTLLLILFWCDIAVGIMYFVYNEYMTMRMWKKKYTIKKEYNKSLWLSLLKLTRVSSDTLDLQWFLMTRRRSIHSLICFIPSLIILPPRKEYNKSLWSSTTMVSDYEYSV